MTSRTIALVAMLSTAGALLAATPAARPPKSLTDEGACPFECCTYREWSVLAETPLLEKPERGSRVVGKARKGTRVRGLTGIVVVTDPGEIEVLRAHTGASGKTYEPGDLVWVYTELGEGFFKVWHEGEMVEEEATFMYHDRGGWDRCVDDGTCWGRRKRFPKSVWWVQVRTAEGLTGWSASPRHFGEMDACG